MLLQQTPMTSSFPLVDKDLGSSDCYNLFRIGTLREALQVANQGDRDIPYTEKEDVDSPNSLKDLSVFKSDSEAARGSDVAKFVQSSGLYSSPSDVDSFLTTATHPGMNPVRSPTMIVISITIATPRLLMFLKWRRQTTTQQSLL